MDRPFLLVFILALGVAIVAAPFLFLGVPESWNPLPAIGMEAPGASGSGAPIVAGPVVPTPPPTPELPPVEVPGIHVSAEGDYEARFPADPVRTTSTRPLEDREIEVRVDMAFLHLVAYNVHVEDHRPKQVEGDIDFRTIDEYLLPSQWEAVERAEVVVDGHSGVQLLSEADGFSGHHYRVDRVFAVGPRLYDVFVFGHEDNFDPARAVAFVESFVPRRLPGDATPDEVEADEPAAADGTSAGDEPAAGDETSAGGEDVAAAEEPGEEPELPWQPFLHEEGRYAVDLPSEPRATERTLVVGEHSLPMTYVGGTLPWGVFGVSFVDYPEAALEGRSPEDVLTSLLSSITSEDGAELQAEYVWIQGRPGRDLLYQGEGPSGTADFHTRVLMDGPRLYLLQAIGDPEHLTADHASRFFESFRVGPGEDEAR